MKPTTTIIIFQNDSAIKQWKNNEQYLSVSVKTLF